MDYAYFNGIVFGEEQSDVTLLGFSALGRLDLESELTGESTKLIDFIADRKKGTVIAGAYLRLYGFTRLSCVVCHNGKLIDIADKTLIDEDEEYSESRQLKVYTLDGLRMALVVDSDVDNAFIWEKLKAEADVVVSVVRSLDLERKNRIWALSREYALPAVVKSDDELFSSVSFDKNEMS